MIASANIYFKLRPHSEVLRVRTTTYLFGVHISIHIREFEIALRYPSWIAGILVRPIMKTETIGFGMRESLNSLWVVFSMLSIVFAQRNYSYCQYPVNSILMSKKQKKPARLGRILGEKLRTVKENKISKGTVINSAELFVKKKEKEKFTLGTVLS